MKTVSHPFIIVTGVIFICAVSISGYAQNGKLNLHVTPRHAYIFADGSAVGEAGKHRSVSLSAGEHKIEVVNYGYVPQTRTVTISAGQSTDFEVTLAQVAKDVTGPFGALTIEGASLDAVLLNGKTPDFFVGHGDEFNHEWSWKQELIVPPGNYQVTILRAENVMWSGNVSVPANQRVVIDVPKGVRKTVPWPRGEKLTSVPRFTLGTASATVAVAKPTAEFSVSAAQINCGDSSQLKWVSSDAPQVDITPVGTVATSGEQAVQPKQSTNYQLTAVGPGGTVTSTATVNVNTAVQANLGLSAQQVQYKRVGNKVVQEGNADLNWTASNASTVSIDPLGSVSPSGTQSLKIVPRKTDTGPVDETVTYTLNASNECGGTTTQTASLRIVGSIEPPPELAMRSVYFPTDIPEAESPQVGLLESEQQTLKSIADSFKQYLEVEPQARLILSGHADKRGPDGYNKDLSERRVELVKNFLIEQGISSGALETQSFGSQQNLSSDEVKQLLQQHPELTEEDRQGSMWRLDTFVFANNRRVDINLSPSGQQSVRQYPYKAEDVAQLIDRNGPKTPSSAVRLASKKEKVAD